MKDSSQQNTGSVIKKGHPNPERLDQTIKIIDPPANTFIIASSVTIIALVTWSIFAEIPSTVPAQAVFLQPHTVSTVKSTGAGRFYFEDDLSAKTSHDIATLVRLVSNQLTKILQNPQTITSPLTMALIKENVNSFFAISTQASADTTMMKNEKTNVDTTQLDLKSGATIGYILNEQTALNFANQLANFSQQAIYNDLEINTNTDLLEKGFLIDKALANRVKILEELSKQGVVSQSTVLQSKQQVLQQYQTNTSQLLAKQSSKSTKSQDLTKLLGTIMASTRGIQLRSPKEMVILSKLVRSGTLVTEGQNIAIATTSKEIPHLIAGFVPAVSFSGVKNGSRVLVSPVNVDVNTYGSIIGYVDFVSPVGLGQDDAQAVVGDVSITKSIYASQPSLFYITIRLEKANTFTGYKWSSSKGPNYKIPITTLANVKIVTNTYRPYQIVLPFLKSITGN
jgi:HlyD family secretion protein